MAETKKSIGIIIYGYSLLVIGLYHIIRDLPSYYYMLRHMEEFFVNLSSVLMGLTIFALPFFRVIGSLKALRRQEIGRKILVYSSFVFFMLITIGAWSTTIYLLHNPGPPIVPEGSIVQVVSLTPTYLIAVFDISAVFYFTRPRVKKQFK